MIEKNLRTKTLNFFNTILKIGAKELSSQHKAQRIYYFNAILLSLPTVYFIFVLIDFQSYFKPLTSWYFDQFSFFAFVFICLICLYLNRLRRFEVSKILFIVSWPLVLHILPIIVQGAPDDYYYAFPIGVIFHSILIQIVFSRKESPWLFWSFLVINFFLVVNFLNFLTYFDTVVKANFDWMTENRYILLVTILYWLLFNFVTHFLLNIIDNEIAKILMSKKIIEDQKHELEVTLDKLQESNTQIIRSEKMTSLGILTAGVAHEINNPLNYIHGSRLGLDNYFKNENINITEELSLFLNSIESGVDRISEILKSLDLYSRNNINTNEVYDIHYVMDHCLEILNVKTTNRIAIKKEYFTDSVKLIGNVAELHQMFINILNNSIYAIENEGVITVKTKNDKQNVIIEIIDTGCGISDKYLLNIMDPFFTTKDPGKGIGLGLSIVYKIIQEHNGNIEFESKIDCGTTVRIVLPIIH